MLNNRKEYLPPLAEVILLAPCEELAVIEWKFGFGSTWKNGYYPKDENSASGIAMNGTFGEGYGFGSDRFFTLDETGTS